MQLICDLDPSRRRPRRSAKAFFATALVISAALCVSGQAGRAQGYYDYGYSYKPRPDKRVAKKATIQKATRPATATTKSSETTVADIKPEGPLLVAVSIGRQRLAVYDNTRLIAEAPISSGRIGYATPTGVFSIVEKNRTHFSNLYGGAPMPNMQRITWSGVALHAGDLPGYPASHGCIRLPHGFSKKLFGLTKVGTRVIVSRDLVQPKSFAHDWLFKAYPPENELQVAQAEVGVRDVASADNGIGIGAMTDAVTQVIGVTAAAASDASHSLKLTYRERRKLEAERLSGELREAGYKRVETSVALSMATREAEAAREPFNAVRAENDRLSSEVRKAVLAKEKAFKELADFERLLDRNEALAADAKLAEKRVQLQDKAAALADAADLADDAWKIAVEASRGLQTAVEEAEVRRRDAATAFATASAKLNDALQREQDMKRRDAKRALPVSVFISRKTQKLYVRQGYQPIFDAAITIDRPDEPIGTHVLTALGYTREKTALDWTVATVPSGGKSKDEGKKKDKDAVETSSRLAVLQLTTSAALDRISIPEDVREQIEDLMKPGSSVIVSDNGLSGETGEYTDFIVATR